MDSSNRVIVAVIAFLFILFWAAVIVALVIFPDQTIDNLRRLLNAFEDNKAFARFVAGLLGAALLLLSLLILILEVYPQETPAVPLTQVTGGTAMLGTDAIGYRIKHDVEQLPAVREAKPSVSLRGRDSVDVKVELQLEPSVRVTEASEEALRQVRASVQELGVKLAGLRVQISHLPKIPSAPREAPPPPPAPPVAEIPSAEEAPQAKAEAERHDEEPRSEGKGPLWDEPSQRPKET